MEKTFTLTESQIKKAFGYSSLKIDNNVTVFYDYKSYDQGGFNYPELTVYITIIDEKGNISRHSISRADESMFGLDREHFFSEKSYDEEKEKDYIKSYAELFIETKVNSVYGGNGIKEAWNYAREKAEKEEKYLKEFKCPYNKAEFHAAECYNCKFCFNDGIKCTSECLYIEEED